MKIYLICNIPFTNSTCQHKLKTLVAAFTDMYIICNLDFRGLACIVSAHSLDSIVMANEAEEAASRYRHTYLKIPFP